MLTSSQCRTVAYSTEHGSIVCTDCAFPRERGDGLLKEIISHSAEEFAGDDGLYCDDCSKVIVEPTPWCETCDEPEHSCECSEAEDEPTDDTTPA